MALFFSFISVCWFVFLENYLKTLFKFNSHIPFYYASVRAARIPNWCSGFSLEIIFPTIQHTQTEIFTQKYEHFGKYFFFTILTFAVLAAGKGSSIQPFNAFYRFASIIHEKGNIEGKNEWMNACTNQQEYIRLIEYAWLVGMRVWVGGWLVKEIYLFLPKKKNQESNSNLICTLARWMNVAILMIITELKMEKNKNKK